MHFESNLMSQAKVESHWKPIYYLFVSKKKWLRGSNFKTSHPASSMIRPMSNTYIHIYSTSSSLGTAYTYSIWNNNKFTGYTTDTDIYNTYYNISITNFWLPIYSDQFYIYISQTRSLIGFQTIFFSHLINTNLMVVDTDGWIYLRLVITLLSNVVHVARSIYTV
jgi:hypothetical protein